MKKVNEHNKLICYGAFDSNKELCSVIYVLDSENRYIFLTSATNEKGKDNKSNFLIVDRFIEDHAETNSIFDFCGSMIKGVEYFNSGFGTVNRYYTQFYINRKTKVINRIKS